MYLLTFLYNNTILSDAALEFSNAVMCFMYDNGSMYEISQSFTNGLILA